MIIFLLTPPVAKAIIYGDDDRVWVEKIKNEEIKTLSRAVGAMVEKRKFIKLNDGSITYSFKDLSRSAWLCKDENFSKFPSLSSCSGFLISSTLLLTAGHCAFMESQCKENSWVFNWDVGKRYFKKNDIYNCKKIIFSNMGEGLVNRDFSLIELDRPVLGILFLKLQKDKIIQRNEEVFVIGHPMGLPKIAALNAKITGMNLDQIGNNLASLVNRMDYFTINADLFGGNSGSPVFNKKDLMVEGLLFEGNGDLAYDEKSNCLRPKISKKIHWEGREKVIRSSTILRILKYHNLEFLK